MLPPQRLVLFTTAAQLLLDLGAQESTRGLARRLNYYYATRGLLCLDEIDYLSYDARAADLLFQVVSRRYEKKSLVLTTNLAFFPLSLVTGPGLLSSG
jgi:DNA replication protein DnaC